MFNLHKRRLNTSKIFNKSFHTGICLLIYLIVQTVLENTYLGIQILLDSAAIKRIPLGISDNNLIVKKLSKKFSAKSIVISKFLICASNYITFSKLISQILVNSLKCALSPSSEDMQLPSVCVCVFSTQ